MLPNFGIRANAFGKFDTRVPKGLPENSPAFQRWVVWFKTIESRRDGRNPFPNPNLLSPLWDLYQLPLKIGRSEKDR